MGAIEWRTRSNVIQSASWVTHTLQVESEFGDALQALTDAETGERGFVMSSSPEFLQPYTSGAAAFEGALDRVRTLTADNSSQQRRLQDIDALARAKLADLAQAVSRAKAGDRDAAMAIDAAHKGRRMEDVRRLVREGIAEEEVLLARRTKALGDAIARRGYWIWGFVALNACVLAALLLLMVRLRRQQLMVTVCTESRTIRHGDEWITFDEYLRRRFEVDISHDLSPAAAKTIAERLSATQTLDRH